MEHTLNDKKPEASSDGAFQIPGEPAVVINGVPNLNAAPDCPARSDVRSDAESNADHGLGEWLEGREVKKLFGEKYYSGKVTYFDRETNWYRVVYEDDDFEDMEWHELQEVLVPVDIAIPLDELSLKFLNHKHSVPKTAKTSGKSKRSRKANNQVKERLVSSDAATNTTDGNQIKRKRGRPRLPEHMRKSNLKKGENKSLNQNSVGETTACQNNNVEPKAEESGTVVGDVQQG
ncbi:uncharacterized protein LOC116257569 [Nymphaea colorata]|nr:uncharacterized protein LOC116257569 [Nymphaea colorata]XP_031490308.1 uncharacterized protein LOC116257569 [Nymphaea colorata]